MENMKKRVDGKSFGYKIAGIDVFFALIFIGMSILVSLYYDQEREDVRVLLLEIYW